MYSRVPTGVNVLALVAALALGAQSRAAEPEFRLRAGIPSLTCDQVLTGLFTPPHPEWGHYLVCTSPEPIETLVPGGWPIERVEALDAFGATGVFNRSRLVRLYGGRRARVARGWSGSGDAFESFTLVSPYPDASLAILSEGTMVIRWTRQ